MRTRLATLAALVATAPFLALNPATTPAATAAEKACEKPMILDHQGSSADGDENTLPAFLGSMRRGADGVETDIQETADGEFIVFHDADLQGDTNGWGDPTDYTLAQIQQLRTLRMGNQIPTLRETLAALAPTGAYLQIELKRPQLWSQPALGNLIRLIKEYGMRDRITLYSTRQATVQRIHTTWPEFNDAWKSPNVTVDPWAINSWTDGAVLNHSKLYSWIVDSFHAAGLKAYSSRIAYEGLYERAVAAGVDSLMVTNVPAYKKWCAAQW